MPERPNVLFLMDDEHRADTVGYAGDEVVSTPTLDRLAEDSAVFENAYTPSPICVPGRQCMMSGQLPMTNGCTGWGDDLDPLSMTFARQFARYGYETTAVGKLHHWGWDQMQGWKRRLAAPIMRVHDEYVEEGEPGALDSEGYSFEMGNLIRKAGAEEGKEADCVEAAEAYIRDYFGGGEPERPLFLKVSLLQPHWPFTTGQEKLDYYGERVEPFVEDPSVKHPALSERYRIEPGEDATEEEIRRATAAYYGMVETVDDYFGRVLDALEAVGEDIDDWVVVFASDHGEMLGEHGVWEKKKYFEGSAGVPLTVSAPGIDGRRVEENVNLCDLFATLCELADVPPPETTLDSRSLVPLMRGETGEWHERYDNESVSAIDGPLGMSLMVKRDDLKYCYYGEDHPEVLFDLAADPRETTNVADEPEYREAMETFRERREELGVGPGSEEYRSAGYAPATGTK